MQLKSPHRVALFVFAVLLTTTAPTMARENQPRAPHPALPRIPRSTVNLADYGKGDGETLNTQAFADALAALAKRGGGRLVVPPGIWLTGPVRLESRTELHVERGALIQFSPDYRLYPLRVVDLRGEKEVVSTSPLSAENAEDIAITGEGIIDGGGDAWRPVKQGKLTQGAWRSLTNSGGAVNDKGDIWWPSKEALAAEKLLPDLRKTGSLNLADYQPYHHYMRPKMVRLIGVKRLLVKDVTLQNPPNWTLNPLLCEDVNILNVQIRNSPTAQNSDALDLESCRRAVIRGCTFDVGDDGICLKSGKDAPGRRIGVPTEDVLVEDCVVYHAHGGFTIGSEMSGGVRNVRVNNCLFMGTDTGLRFKSTRGRGGVVENIFISNVNMTDIPGDAINFNLYYGGKSTLEEADSDEAAGTKPVTEATPQFRDIHMENIVCRGARNAIVLQGLPEMPLRNITLRNVSMSSQKGVSVTDASGIVFDRVQVQHTSGETLTTTRVTESKLEVVK